MKLENCVPLDMTGELVICLLIGLNRVTQFEYSKVCNHTYTNIRNKLFSCKIYMRSVQKNMTFNSNKAYLLYLLVLYFTEIFTYPK